MKKPPALREIRARTLLNIPVMFLLFTILFATNPDEDQFNDYLKQTIKTEAHKEGALMGALMDVFASPTAWAISLTTERQDYYLFSTYVITVPGKKQGYIGFLNHFVPVN